MSCRVAKGRERDVRKKENRSYIFFKTGDAVLTSNDCNGEDVDEERHMLCQSSDGLSVARGCIHSI